MLNVRKEQKGEVMHIRLSGSLGEGTNFNELIGNPPPQSIHVNCKEILRINSMGVKAWINYFQAARNQGTRLKLQECSTAIVKQINLISNFVCGGEVESIFAPFSCPKCKAEFNALLSVNELGDVSSGGIPRPDCIKCGDKAHFDDIPEEYFGFLMR